MSYRRVTRYPVCWLGLPTTSTAPPRYGASSRATPDHRRLEASRLERAATADAQAVGSKCRAPRGNDERHLGDAIGIWSVEIGEPILHARFAQPKAFGAKVSDEFTVPLCRDHHRELHNNGNERA